MAFKQGLYGQAATFPDAGDVVVERESGSRWEVTRVHDVEGDTGPVLLFDMRSKIDPSVTKTMNEAVFIDWDEDGTNDWYVEGSTL